MSYFSIYGSIESWLCIHRMRRSKEKLRCGFFPLIPKSIMAITAGPESYIKYGWERKIDKRGLLIV